MAQVIFYELEDWERAYLSSRSAWPKLSDCLLSAEPLTDSSVGDAEASIISVFVDSRVTADCLAKFPSLKLIATRSTGFDHIDLAYCREHGIAVANVPSYGEDTVAEYTFALLLTLSRRIYDAYAQVRESGSFALDNLRGFDLKGKVLGVIGTGRIGKNVIEIAKGFNLEIVAYDKFPDEAYAQKMAYRYLPFDEVLRLADILTLHVPYSTDNHHLLNKNNLSLLKPGMVLLNTARGALVETDALVRGLKEGIIAGAGLDVLEEEGFVKEELTRLTSRTEEAVNFKTVLQNHLLIDLPNVIVTPHNAFNTWEALKRILDTSLDNVLSWQAGQAKNLVT